MFGFNVVGFGIVVFGFGAAYGIGALLGATDDGMLLILGGPLTMALDLLVRLKGEDGHWIIPNRGGYFVFIPIWILGAIWTVLGVLTILKLT
jgi:hypothetical protein